MRERFVNGVRIGEWVPTRRRKAFDSVVGGALKVLAFLIIAAPCAILMANAALYIASHFLMAAVVLLSIGLPSEAGLLLGKMATKRTGNEGLGLAISFVGLIAGVALFLYTFASVISAIR